MDEEVYFRLREFLDRLPGGYPATESGVELKILRKLYTPEQAHIAVHLRQRPEPAFVIARRVGMNTAEIKERLEVMAKAGLIYRVRIARHTFYMAMQFVIGVYELHLNEIDREFAELLEEYFPVLGRVWESTKTKQLRIVPINSALDATPSVSTYYQVRELVKGKKHMAVAPCICQKEQQLLGHGCDRPIERCLVFDQAAEHYIENGLGRPITREELMDILKMGEEKALVLSPTNSKDILNICMCCGCCCGMLRLLKQLPRPADHAHSPVQARIDPTECSSCGLCVERCQVDAIVQPDDAYHVDPARCIGCGLCVPTCPTQAISLVPKKESVPIPGNFFETQKRIAKERGVV